MDNIIDLNGFGAQFIGQSANPDEGGLEEIARMLLQSTEVQEMPLEESQWQYNQPQLDPFMMPQEQSEYTDPIPAMVPGADFPHVQNDFQYFSGGFQQLGGGFQEMGGVFQQMDVVMMPPPNMEMYRDGDFDKETVPHLFTSTIGNHIMSSPGDIALLEGNSPAAQDSRQSSSSAAPSPQTPLDAPANSARNPSHSRVLVPQQPRSRGPAGSLSSVATASSPQDEGGPSPFGAGPMKKVYDIPPRPKPGRKPATDEPQSKRKAQNRESQRAFRARKAQKVQELTSQVEIVQQQHREEVNALAAELDHWKRQAQDLQEQNARLIADRDWWKQQHDNLKNGASSPHPAPHMVFNAHMPESSFDPMLTTANTREEDEHVPTPNGNYTGVDAPNSAPDCSTCGPDDCACMDAVMRDSMRDPPFMDAVPLKRRGDTTPMQGVEKTESPAYDPQEHEIDFTTKFARPAVDTLMEGEHETCGFCTNPDNCFCRDQSLQAHAEPLSIPPNGDSTSSEAAPVLLGPGSCEQCQADPKMRAWCQGVARLRADPTPPSSRRSSGIGPALKTMEPRVECKIDNFSQMLSPIPGTRSIGCTEAYKLLDGRVSMDVDHSDIRRLRPVPPQSFDARRESVASMEPGTYSAMEVDVGSILTTLQHSREPLKPRPSDGRNANIITKAEELRRASGSPYVSSPLQNGMTQVSAFDLAS